MVRGPTWLCLPFPIRAGCPSEHNCDLMLVRCAGKVCFDREHSPRAAWRQQRRRPNESCEAKRRLGVAGDLASVQGLDDQIRVGRADVRRAAAAAAAAVGAGVDAAEADVDVKTGVGVGDDDVVVDAAVVGDDETVRMRTACRQTERDRKAPTRMRTSLHSNTALLQQNGSGHRDSGMEALQELGRRARNCCLASNCCLQSGDDSPLLHQKRSWDRACAVPCREWRDHYVSPAAVCDAMEHASCRIVRQKSWDE